MRSNQLVNCEPLNSILLSLVPSAIYKNVDCRTCWNRYSLQNELFHWQQFPLWTTLSRQLAVWPVSSAGTEMDREVGTDAASSHPVHCHISVETADGRYVSCFCLTCLLPGTWPLPYTQTQPQTQCVCPNTHTHGTKLRVFTCVMSWSWASVLIQRV